MFLKGFFKWLVLAILILFGGLVYAGGGSGDPNPETEDHPWGDLKGNDDPEPKNPGTLGKLVVIIPGGNPPLILIAIPKDNQKEQNRVKTVIPLKIKFDQKLPTRR